MNKYEERRQKYLDELVKTLACAEHTPLGVLSSLVHYQEGMSFQDLYDTLEEANYFFAQGKLDEYFTHLEENVPLIVEPNMDVSLRKYKGALKKIL